MLIPVPHAIAEVIAPVPVPNPMVAVSESVAPLPQACLANNNDSDRGFGDNIATIDIIFMIMVIMSVVIFTFAVVVIYIMKLMIVIVMIMFMSVNVIISTALSEWLKENADTASTKQLIRLNEYDSRNAATAYKARNRFNMEDKDCKKILVGVSGDDSVVPLELLLKQKPLNEPYNQQHAFRNNAVAGNLPAVTFLVPD
ncbi:hypothetical protein INT43_001010 [Umbelopsis isabellina]|uniref:Uncharacterized protein n=1 Tax=Mortierella isabellina TaxID=91625 RepID=A0A8H7Q2U2_MORIS|nr:hypothetical protein INT43_001010 [Umbelopsis isabellina]